MQDYAEISPACRWKLEIGLVFEDRNNYESALSMHVYLHHGHSFSLNNYNFAILKESKLQS